MLIFHCTFTLVSSSSMYIRYFRFHFHPSHIYTHKHRQTFDSSRHIILMMKWNCKWGKYRIKIMNHSQRLSRVKGENFLLSLPSKMAWQWLFLDSWTTFSDKMKFSLSLARCVNVFIFFVFFYRGLPNAFHSNLACTKRKEYQTVKMKISLLLLRREVRREEGLVIGKLS